MLRVNGFDHIVLRVRDLKRSLQFYEGLLNLPVEGREEYAAGERPFLSLRIDGQLIDLWPDPDYDSGLGNEHGGLFHFCLRVDGKLIDVLPELKQAGVTILENAPALRFGATGYGDSIYVRDPDDYVLELKESGNKP